jgi:hypothetical protein
MNAELRESRPNGTGRGPQPDGSSMISDGQRTFCGEPLRRFVPLAAGLLLMAALLAGFAAHRGVQISPFDEATHADYAWQIAHGHIPAKGSVIAPEIRYEWSCHGAVAPTKVPACGVTDAPLTQYPAGAQDYNFGHPPLYYAITGVIARALNAVFPGHHFILFGRLVGIGWLYAAMIVLYFAVRRFGADWRFATTAAALLPLCPVILHASSAMTNDAAAALSGAAAVWVMAHVLVRGKTGWLTPALITLLCTATKILNVLPILAVGAVFLIIAIARWRSKRSDEAKRLLLIVIGIGAAFLLVYVGWRAFQHGRGVANWVSPIKGVSGKKPTHVVADLLSTSFNGLFSLTSDYYLPRSINFGTVTIWSRALTALTCSVPFVLLAATPQRTPRWTLGAALLGGLLAYPLIVELQVYTSGGLYFPNVVVRYGMSLIPLAIAGVALVAWQHKLARTFALFATLGVVAVGIPVFGLN